MTASTLGAAVVTAGSAAAGVGVRQAPGLGAGVERRISDRRITESSGLALGLLHPTVLYTHNDSGNPARIYAIGTSGATRATLTVRAEPNVDWEAMSILRAPAGTRAAGRDLGGLALLAIGDIGDNNARHPVVRIALVPEPERLRPASVTPVRVLRLRYPDGARDAEALLADPRDGRLYIVSKTLFGSEVFAVPEKLWPGSGAGSPARVSPVTTLTKVGATTANLITDGAFLPDGRMLLRGYGRVSVVDRPESVRNGRIKTLATEALPDQDQGESIAVTDSGRAALIGSEGTGENVLRVPVPDYPGSASNGTATLPPDPAAEPSGSSAPGSSAPGSPTALGDGQTGATVAGGTVARGAAPTISAVGSLRSWALLIGAALTVLALGFALIMFRVPRSQRRRR